MLIAIAVVLVGLYIKGKIKDVILISGLTLLSSYDLIAEGRKYLNEDNFVEPNDFESAFAPTPANIQISKDPDKNFRVLDEPPEAGIRTRMHLIITIRLEVIHRQNLDYIRISWIASCSKEI